MLFHAIIQTGEDGILPFDNRQPYGEPGYAMAAALHIGPIRRLVRMDENTIAAGKFPAA